MISDKILTLLKQEAVIKNFLGNVEVYEILVKEIGSDEIVRIITEFPNLFGFKESFIQKKDALPSILCITIVKRDDDEDNHIKLKKIKLYIDVINDETIKILQN